MVWLGCVGQLPDIADDRPVRQGPPRRSDVRPTRKPLRPRSIPDLPGAIRQRSDLDVWQGFCPAHSADLCRKVREAGDTYDRLDSWKSNPDRWLQSSPKIGRASCME